MSKRNKPSLLRRIKLIARKAGKEPTFTEALEDLVKKSPKPKRKITLPVRAALKKPKRARVRKRALVRLLAKNPERP